ncbi:hypothetical protein AAC387_Pa05g3094 [Persea americana]
MNKIPNPSCNNRRFLQDNPWISHKKLRLTQGVSKSKRSREISEQPLFPPGTILRQERNRFGDPDRWIRKPAQEAAVSDRKSTISGHQGTDRPPGEEGQSFLRFFS